MRAFILMTGCAAALAACSSVPPPAPSPAEPERAEPPPHVLAPVPHDGPIAAQPGFYDCGVVREHEDCEFDVLLRNESGDTVIIDRFSQDFAPTARIGLVEHRTGFDRDLPYEMGSETLRLLFSYRLDNTDEVVGGSLFLDYHVASQAYRLEIPIGAQN